MKGFQKITAFFIALCMMVSVMPVAHAQTGTPPCALLDISAEPSAADAVDVRVSAGKDCTLLAALYDENGAMLAVGMTDVKASGQDQTVSVPIPAGGEEYHLAKSFLLDAGTKEPLCAPLTTASDCVLYSIEVSNTLIGTEEGAADTFQFRMSTDSTSGLVMPADTSACIRGAGSGTFRPIKFTAAGTYMFYITCESGGTEFRPDSRTLKVTVSVTGSGSSMTAKEVSREYLADGAAAGVQTSFIASSRSTPQWSSSTLARAEEIMAGMTMEEKVGQLFLVHYPGDGSGSVAQAKNIIDKWHPGGFLVFAAMFSGSNPATLKNKTAAAQSAAKIPMLFSVDEEGGKVVRVSSYPAFRSSQFQGPQEVKARGGVPAVEADAAEKARFLKDLGLNVNHAPVADVSGSSGYIYPRTYGGTGMENAPLVAAAVRGHEENGVATTMKHFPGYGGTSSNTHNGFAVNDLALGDFQYNDLLPFYAGMAAGGKGVMVTHNIINCMDPDNPASLSPKVISYLREEMGYDGVVMTDDLNMGAITDAVASTGPNSASLRAILAGVDMPMTAYPDKQIPVVLAAIQDGTLSMDRVEESCRRVLCWKIEMGLIDSGGGDTPDPPIEEEAEGRWTSVDGSAVKEGGFDDMWALAAGNGGTVTMLQDVDTTGDKLVSGNRVSLNLNGHKLWFTDGVNGFLVDDSGELTIGDSVEPEVVTEVNPANREEAGYNAVRRILVYYTMADDGATVSKHEVDMDACGSVGGANTGVMIEVESGRFTLDGGVLSHQVRAVESVHSAGNVINIQGGAVVGCGAASGGTTVNGSAVGIFGGGKANISGGYIGGSAATTRGGGIYLDPNGGLTMTGGVIAANSGLNGGAIYGKDGSSIQISGGVIASNTSSANGGAVYGINSKIFISGGAVITENRSGNGGGVFNYGGSASIDITGGLFSGNSATNGGAVAAGTGTSGGGALSIRNAVFAGNTASANGGAVNVEKGTKKSMLTDISVYHNTAGTGAGLYLASGAELSGRIEVHGNTAGTQPSNIYLTDGGTISLSAILAEGSSVGISTESKPEGAATVPVASSAIAEVPAGCKAMFFSDEDRYSISVDGSTLVLGMKDAGQDEALS